MSCGGNCGCGKGKSGSADAAADVLNKLKPTVYFAKEPPPGADGVKAPWWMKAFRITRVRVFAQAFFFGLFLFFIYVTWFSKLKGYPVSLLLDVVAIDGFSTAFSILNV
jgi:hypothetical protein